MVGYTPSLSTAVWVGTAKGDKPLVNASGSTGLRLGSAVGHLEGDDGRRTEGHLQRVLPQADRDRRLRRCAGAAATAARARHRDDTSSSPASKWRRASRSRSARPRRSRRAAAARRHPAGRRRRAAPQAPPSATAAVTGAQQQSADHFAAAAGRRSAQRRRPRLPQPHRLSGRRAVGCRRWPGGPARADRPHQGADPAAGDVLDRAGVPGARLVDESGLPAEHRHRDRRPARRQLGEPARVLRVVLLRHGAAVRRGVVEPGQVSVQVELDRDRRHRRRRRPATTAGPRCATWSIRC